MSLEIDAIFAPLPPCERGVPHVINGDRKQQKNILYTNGYNVIIRNIENPKICELYAEHQKRATVAQYSPTGFYICSGDVTGKIRVWDTQTEERILKNEYQIFAGEIKDIAWDCESKRIAVCGYGKDTCGATIMWDSGNSVGKITNLIKANSIDFKPNRPYRVIAGDEQSTLNFYTGPPFAFKTKKMENQKFVQCCRYSPDGKYFAVCTSDCTIRLYEGKEGEFIGSFLDGKKAHAGGIYCLSWSPDSKELLSASGDKTCKIWNAESREMVTKFEMGKTVDDMVVSCMWQDTGKVIVAVTVNGHISYLDRENPSTPSKVIRGHKKAVYGLSTNSKDCNIIYSCDMDGRVIQWKVDSGEAEYIKGKGHGKKTSGVLFDAENNQIITYGNDDALRFSCASSLEFGAAIDLGSQPISAALMDDGFIVVLCHKELVVVKAGRKVSSVDHESIELNDPKYMVGHGTNVIVSKDKEGFMVFDMSSCGSLKHREDVAAVVSAGPFAFSQDGSLLAVGQGNNTIRVYTMDNGFEKHQQLIGHSVRVLDLSISPDNMYVASTATDCNLYITRLSDKNTIKEPGVHQRSNVNKLEWLNNDTVITAGNDAVIKFWKVAF